MIARWRAGEYSPALLPALIHPSAWKAHSPFFVLKHDTLAGLRFNARLCDLEEPRVEVALI
jgi:hypothetical protein